MNSRTESLIKTYKPQLSIVVYKAEGMSDEFYLESHSINEGGQIMEGKPLLQETLQGIVDVFYDERQNTIRITGYIPENVLLFSLLPGGNYKIIWCRPAEVRFIPFAPQLHIKSATAWVPAMVYVVDRKSLSVFALKSNSRPKENTKLYRAPFHNVSDQGSVCLGSAKVKKPATKTYDSLMRYWEDLFWLSEFTHLNGASNPTKTDMDKVWRKLVACKEKIKWSDMDELNEMKNKTLKHLLK